MNRDGARPSIAVEHKRASEPSEAKLWLFLVGKREDIVEVLMTEKELLVLANECLSAAILLRRVNGNS